MTHFLVWYKSVTHQSLAPLLRQLHRVHCRNINTDAMQKHKGNRCFLATVPLFSSGHGTSTVAAHPAGCNTAAATLTEHGMRNH